MVISGIKIYNFRNILLLITDMGTVLNHANIVINFRYAEVLVDGMALSEGSDG